MINYFKKRLSLTITLVLFVFGVLLTTFTLIGTSLFILQRLGIVSIFDFHPSNPGLENRNRYFSLIVLFGLCILLGTALTALFSKKTLNPIRKVIAAIYEVAQGNFDVRVDLKGIGELEELSESFNKMTHELSSIETLRGDFVNNFSHEFKTPIVSIRGFAKLLKENQISEEDRQEYLDIIISESNRLAELSTNMLNLSKYEHTSIVTNTHAFRLDEQIRKAIVLMESKWSAKDISLGVDLEDIIYLGNEELTQQIWINLIDNAIKFSHIGGNIDISLLENDGQIIFTIKDEGLGMNEETKTHIFEKFYQSDPSHAKAGNGLGLALVKRIVNLCHGEILVESEIGLGSQFVVLLSSKA